MVLWVGLQCVIMYFLIILTFSKMSLSNSIPIKYSSLLMTHIGFKYQYQLLQNTVATHVTDKYMCLLFHAKIKIPLN